MFSNESRPCRVCGHEFVPSRFDAKTCKDACRQRLHRGGDLAYLADLDPQARLAARKRHAEIEREIADRHAANVAEREARFQRRYDPGRFWDRADIEVALIDYWEQQQGQQAEAGKEPTFQFSRELLRRYRLPKWMLDDLQERGVVADDRRAKAKRNGRN